MTKAFLMNSTRYLTGVNAKRHAALQHQGMGEVNLGTGVRWRGARSAGRIEHEQIHATGQTRTFAGSVVDVTKSFRVTLAWTDAPAHHWQRLQQQP